MNDDNVLGGKQQKKHLDQMDEEQTNLELFNQVMRDLADVDEWFWYPVAGPDQGKLFPPKEDGSDSNVPYGDH